MITASQIRQVSDKIAQRFQPERIILFGSYAYGTPTEDSDVDLLVVMPLPNKGRDRASDIRQHLDVSFPMDLVIYDPDYLQERIQMNDFFCVKSRKGDKCYMQAITQEWVDKAEGDWGSMGREGQVQNAPNYDLVCYLAQQRAEKYVKARLQEGAIPFPKTHNLPALLALVLPIEPSWNVLRQALTKLDDYGVDFRYPGNNANLLDSQSAQQYCQVVREVARRSLGLPI